MNNHNKHILVDSLSEVDRANPEITKLEAEIEKKYEKIAQKQQELERERQLEKQEKKAKMVAEETFIYYQAYINAGFTPEVALILLRDYMDITAKK